MADPRTETSGALVEPLTNREREILKALVEGLSNQEIAERLHLALRTVKWYNTQIYSKLGVGNRRAAIANAQARGLLKVDSDGPRFTPRNNIPLASTRFVGRQEELTRIANHFADEACRLVTILAPGGMGKTRLALAAAERQVRQYRDGVFFVPLAALSSLDDMISAIADCLGLRFYGGATPQQQLVDNLRERQVLLVLDNFEHLLDDGALLVAEIMRTAPAVCILVTSRELLQLKAERICALRGLAFPATHSAEQFQGYDAVRLFILSARRVYSGYEPQPHDLNQIARICRLTEGMPLAIELAAGWLDTLSLEHIENEIARGIDILESELRDLPERHRSVRATFEQTWRRLTEDERLIFMRLSVFRGGFGIQAAEAIAGATPQYLRRSVQKALIQAEGDERFAIHELLRQFGAKKLAESGSAEATQLSHALYFADFMHARRRSIFSSQQLVALREIGVNFENIRFAWHVLLERQAFDELRKFLDCLVIFLDVHNRGKEGIELLEGFVNALQSLPSSDANELALARVWARLSWSYSSSGVPEKGKVVAEAAIRLFTRHDSPEDLLVAYVNLAVINMFRWDHENTRLIAEAGRKLARKAGNQYWEANCLVLLSHAARITSADVDAIMRPARQARAIFENLENPWGMTLSYATEAMGAFVAGDLEHVRNSALKCQEFAKALGNVFFIGLCAIYLGVVASRQGNNAQAWNWLCQALHSFRDACHERDMPVPLFVMAQLLLSVNKADLAVEILAVAERIPVPHGLRALVGITADGDKELRRDLLYRLGPDHFATAWAQGEKRGLSAVVVQLLSEGFEESPPDRSLRGS